MKHSDRFYVYCYAEPGKPYPFYIGKGKGDRAYQHLRPSILKVKNHFHCKLRGMLQRGIDPRIEFLRVCLSEGEAFALEEFMILKWGRLDLGTGPLTNATSGGDGVSGISEEVRERISAALRGKPLSLETREKMSVSRTGKVATPETRRKLSAAKKGQKPSPEALAKMSAWHTGKTVSPETREKISAAVTGTKRTAEAREKMADAQRQMKGRRVQSTDPQTGEVRIYEVVSDVVKDGFSQGNVSECCQGNRVTHKGLLWHYCDQPILRDEAKEKAAAANNRRAGRSVQSKDPITGEVKVYRFMSEVRKDGFSQGTVGQCCQGKRATHKKLIWSYLDEPIGQGDRVESLGGVDAA